ncbi:MAG: chloride channel protein [Alphaproteobacteria bacterium]|nr:chloride channel protein [Alphaproteobacteria bacterium]
MIGVSRVLIAQVAIVALIGGFVSFCAHFFVAGIQYFENFRSQQTQYIDIFGFSFNLWTAGLLISAYLLVILVRTVGHMPKWESPADIIYCAQNRQHQLATKGGLLTIFASFVSLAGGASLGQYGPLVHLGGTIGVAISRWYHSVWLGRDVIIGCGVAAAISAGFNAPIAGIIFAHEAVLRHFSGRSLALISIASVSSSTINRTLFDTVDIFEITQSFTVSGEMAVISLIAGVGFGISAIFMIRALFTINMIASYSKTAYRWLAVLGLIYLIFLSQTLPEVLGLGIGVINNLFTNVETTEMLFILLAAKLSAVILSATMGFSGGFVGPALFIGAVLGALLANLAVFFGLSSLTMMLVVSGSAAVAGTVFGAPLGMVILVLELTHSYDLTLAAMLSIIVSSLIFHLFYGHSLFDLQLLARGIDLAKGRIFLELETTKLASLATDDFLSFTPEVSKKTIIEKMQKNKLAEAYCITEDGSFLGKISIFDVMTASQKTAASLANPNCLQLLASQSINDAMKIAIDFVGEAIPVIDPQNQQLVGVVSEADLFRAYSTITQRVREIETA